MSLEGMIAAQEDMREFKAYFQHYIYALFDEDYDEMLVWIKAMEKMADEQPSVAADV